MSRIADRAQAARLRQLAQLARLQADLETARLGETARARGRMLAALAGLGRGEDPLAPEAPVDPPPGGLPAPVAPPAAGAGPASAQPGCAPGPVAQADGAGVWPAAGPAHRPEAESGRAGPGPEASALSGVAAPREPSVGADLSARAIPALVVRARLAHRAWIEARRAELQMRLARIEADWHRLRPRAARAFGRAEVLGALADTAERQAQHRADRHEGAPLPAGPGPPRRS